MATEILAIGKTGMSSSDVVVASGAPLTVCIKDGEGPIIDHQAYIDIELKADNGQYFAVDRLTQRKPAVVIQGAGTYRFTRPAGASCGVFSG